MSPIGIDTSFLVAIEATVHERGFSSRELFDRLERNGEVFALNPDVLSEFVHVMTDPKRLVEPWTAIDAIQQAKTWWASTNIIRVFPTDSSTNLFLDWCRQYRLGRKRLRDTMLAASYFSAGVTRIATLNPKDFEVFGCFELIVPPPAVPSA